MRWQSEEKDTDRLCDSMRKMGGEVSGLECGGEEGGRRVGVMVYFEL